MVKKTKKGKDRLDKYYQLAKDQGYRARSAFKLIQLAKKNDFLSNARVCLDLCAAPGGWSQVAQKHMPSGSTIVAIDLAPIKAIHGVTCIQSDITTDKCRSLLKKELLGKRADVVLHDGAPNVGTSWAKDAFAQNELTLHSLKLACEHLRAGGTFVTKVFRSADYNSLMWVFGQLFNKVDATKPTASRNVSAEIFVLCLGFKAGKIDPKFFDPKYVFMETLEQPEDANKKSASSGLSLNEHLKNAAKKHRGGYEEGDDLKIIPAHEFLAAQNPAEVLVTHHRISLSAKGSESLAEHSTTTEEIQELFADLKVLGKTDLTKLLKWRVKILREREKAERAARKAAQAESESSSTKAAKKAQGGGEKAEGSLANDVDDAIAELLEDGDKKPKGKKPAAKGGDDDDDDEDDDEELEQELAEQVEKRRREERRDAKKTMARQKKAEWKRKMSLGVTKQSQDQPELFKRTASAEFALENQDDFLDPGKLDSDAEDSDDEEEADSDSDDDELDRLAKMEVDVAVDQQLRRMRDEDKYRTQEQRKRKKKKETRRQRVMAAWAGEMNAFNEAIDQKAATEHALKDKDSDDEDFDSEDDLQALRELQEAGEKSKGALDGDALEALADGPPGDEPDDSGGDEDEEEDGEDGEAAEGAAKTAKKATSTALVPVVDQEELKAEHRMERWFSQDIFKSAGGGAIKSSSSNRLVPLDRDSEEESSDGEGAQIRELDDNQLPKMPLTDKEKRKLKRKQEDKKAEKQGKKQKTNEEDAGPMEVAPLEAPKPLVPQGDPLKPSDPQELAETLALGSVLAESKKSRMDIIDAAYNRFAFDKDDLLPDWFTEEEERYNKPELPISKELMAQFRAKLREINARPIRKVAEARARKKRRLNKRLEKLRSTAMSLADSTDMSEVAKARQMRKAVNKLAKQDERKVTVVAIKKGGGGKRMDKKAPKGAKVKVVDRRMKSDMRGLKKAAARNKSKTKAMNRKQAKKKQAKSGARRGASAR